MTSNNQQAIAITTANNNHNDSSAYATALLRSLQFSGVKFLRYATLDASNNLRVKTKLVDQLLNQPNASLNYQVSIAEVCYAGLPYYQDAMVEGSGLDASKVLIVQPDPSSFRILPYAPKSAMVMGNSYDQFTHELSPLCTRSLLSRVLQRASTDFNIGFRVGVELEFCLVHANTHQFVDNSVFCNSVTLNDREEFLLDLTNQLQQQHIPIELVHAESGPGQLEVVLEHSDDVVGIADNVLFAKETISACAKAHGYKALFLPKYHSEKAGNGMHVHVSMHDATTKQPLFAAENQQQALSPQGSSFVEGVLQHLPALMSLTMPTCNSFKRVGKGCWTGSQVGWACEDKEVGIRVCSNLQSRQWDHFECKLFDATSNIYLGLAALLHCGMDGLAQQAVLRPPLGSLSNALEEKSTPLPATLEEALDSLQEDTCLIQNILGPKLSKAYLALKRHEAERYAFMSLEDEVKEALSRC